jgi:hypothetical protein
MDEKHKKYKNFKHKWIKTENTKKKKNKRMFFIFPQNVVLNPERISNKIGHVLVHKLF